MDNRIIMLIMSLTTFLAYPFLSGDGRKQVAPLASSQDDDSDDQDEMDDEEGEPVIMDDEDDDEERL